MYASVDTATWQAIAWRDSNFVIGSRMAQLHHDPESAHQNDFWVDFTRGRNRTNNFGHAMNRTYDRVSVGYDRLVGHGWTVGLAYGYEKGTEGYEKGSGDSTGNVVTAYATWQGANGNYVDMTIKGGQLESDFTVQDDNQVTPSKADTRATGAGVSAVYGHRFENASAFYVEPHAGFYWSHLGGYDYRLSDGSDVSVDGCNSFVGNLGVNIGKHLGKGEVYARADFMHDFSGNVRVSMTKAGLNNTMENPLHDSWLNVAVGYRQNYDRVGWYAEAGCQSIGSRESSGDWVWKAGVEFKF
jgi:outer membrane autotransporter protein